MKAMLCHAFDGPDALELGEAPAPVPAADEVLIAVDSAAVNFMDLLMTQGGYQLRPDLPYVPGTDAAGTVVEVGAGVTEYSPGDRVVGTGWYGAFAERMAVKQWRCTGVPEEVDLKTASTVAQGYLTAWYSLVEQAGLQPGETLFVTGAAGGVGLATVDVGRMLGARVIAGIGDDAKADIVRRYGASEVINLRTEDLRSRIKELTDGNGVDVCFEMLGGETFLTMGRLMAWNGRLMPIGFVAGEIPALPMNLPLLKNYAVVGAFVGAWNDRCPEESAAAQQKVVDLVAEGRLTPHVDRVLPLAEAAEAMRLVADREVQGRVVLEVAGG